MIAMMYYGDIKKLLLGADGDARRLEIVMDLGKDLAPVPGDAQCTEIVGCASFVQICRRGNNFYGRADSALVRGIVAILLAMVDGRDATQIKNMDLYGEFMSLGLKLGTGRLGGVNSMIRFLQNL